MDLMETLPMALDIQVVMVTLHMVLLQALVGMVMLVLVAMVAMFQAVAGMVMLVAMVVAAMD